MRLLGTSRTCSFTFWLIRLVAGQRRVGHRRPANNDFYSADPLLSVELNHHPNTVRQLLRPHNSNWDHNRGVVPREDWLKDHRRGNLPETTELSVGITGPGAAFSNQQVTFTSTTTNIGDHSAHNVVVLFTLPTEGIFISSSPPVSLSGNSLSVSLGRISPGESMVVLLEWETPSSETMLRAEVQANADNASPVSDREQVQVGIATIVMGGVTSAGTGLRNRPGGTISITAIPSSATVTRAVLVWAILYDSTTMSVPSDEITLNGSTVKADLTAAIGQSLCWEDDATIGYAADVTSLVMGNGDHVISNAINGVYRVDSVALGELPYTDGASLFVFYEGPGINNQVLSDFTYSAVDAGIGGFNTRTLTDIISTGGTSTLHIAGPDGQNTGSEQLTITVIGQNVLAFADSWEGSAPQDEPDFPIGNLWDNDILNVSSVLPSGQRSLEVRLGPGFPGNAPDGTNLDCVGVSAVALEVEQAGVTT